MKKYRLLLDVVLLAGLGAMSFVAIAPETVVMPTSVQMLLLAIVSGLIAAFLVLLWRERPSDEREMQNQAYASRMAYFVGCLILIVALVINSLRHELRAEIPIALLGMIATKIIVQSRSDRA